MDKNKVFCPFDCAPYPLDGCNDSIGECEQCSLEGKWRYTSCIDGYSLYEGKCTPQNCEEDGALFQSGTPNTTIADESQIEYCWKDGDKSFRYRGCRHGWEYDPFNYHCDIVTDCGKDYVDLEGELCPLNANCDDVCYEFNESTGEATAKTNIVCKDGLRLQPKGDISGESYKCRKHPVGNIAFYCNDPSEIPEGLDPDGDQIITLDPEEYDTRPKGCSAIGIVFDNDNRTKIISLTNAASGAWSSCHNNGTGRGEDPLCNIAWLTDSTSTDRDGYINTEAMILWAKMLGHTTTTAQNTRDYYPGVCVDINGDGTTNYNTACGKGKWYLPSYYELTKLYNRTKNTNSLVKNAISKLTENEISVSSVGGGVYFQSSNEIGNILYAASINGGNNSTGKHHGWSVRPVLIIE